MVQGIKNLPCSAGDVGLIPGEGSKVPHAAEKLGLHAELLGPFARTRQRPWARGMIHVTQWKSHMLKQPNTAK